MAFHRHNERGAGEQILTRLAQGERIALVSDAGTPGVCDPGALLVRAALAAGQQQGERGEFVVVVDARVALDPEQAELDEISRRWLRALAEEMPAARAA